MKGVFVSGVHRAELIPSIDLSIRRQGSNKVQDGQGSLGDPESAREDNSNYDRRLEVVEPRPEPEPSARDDFHQEYTKKLQNADRDVEDFSNTLDSLSYPVSDTIPLFPRDR
jgi:hypothetical protein